MRLEAFVVVEKNCPVTIVKYLGSEIDKLTAATTTNSALGLQALRRYSVAKLYMDRIECYD